jgi:hypothetical protein
VRDGDAVDRGRRPNQRLSEIAGKPTFRIIDGVSIRFVESDPGSSEALLLSPWPESLFAYVPAGTIHSVKNVGNGNGAARDVRRQAAHHAGQVTDTREARYVNNT